MQVKRQQAVWLSLTIQTQKLRFSILTVGKYKWKTQASSSGMGLRTVLPEIIPKEWVALFLQRVFFGEPKSQINTVLNPTEAF